MPDDESFERLGAEDQARALSHLDQTLSLTRDELLNPANEFELAIYLLASSALQLRDIGVPRAHIVHMVKCALHAAPA